MLSLYQKFDESFNEAWERFKKMIRACPHHGFTELTQVDTFLYGLIGHDQGDSLNAQGWVKFTTCTLLGAALTWWNSQIRTLGPEEYAMTWEVLKKKMTNKYCPQGEIKKLEIQL
ncbi:hypothetical protein Tco_0603009 [Tanacetum coccineum]